MNRIAKTELLFAEQLAAIGIERDIGGGRNQRQQGCQPDDDIQLIRRRKGVPAAR